MNNNVCDVIAIPCNCTSSGQLLNSRIPELDGLRGIAIIFVLISHLWQRSGGNSNFLFANFLGGVGVHIFFALSFFCLPDCYEKNGIINKKSPSRNF